MDSKKCIVCKQGLMAVKLKASRLVENISTLLATEVDLLVLVQGLWTCAVCLDKIHRKFFLGKFISTFRPKFGPKALQGVGK